MPIISRYIKIIKRAGIRLVLMQDGAPRHATANIKKDLQEKGIRVIFWPSFSPNLNPIKRV